MKAMDVINAVQIFMLLWSFTAVCHGDTGDCGVSCNDVTGTVGKQVILSCSFSEQCTEDCVIWYKFQYTKEYKDSDICREGSPDGLCKKKKTFTCRYTPDTAMKETFRFFVQTKSSTKLADFTVDIAGHGSLVDGPEKDQPIFPKHPGHEETPVSAISAGVGCFIIIFIIIILTIIIIYKKYPGGIQKIQMTEVAGQNDHGSNAENV